MKLLTIVAVVGDLFFPRSAELGLAVEDTVSPRILAKMVYAGTKSSGFVDAEDNLLNLANLAISAERIRRATERIGQDRIDAHGQLQDAYLHKSLPQQQVGKPADVDAPDIACVMCDGGRLQMLDRTQPNIKVKSARKGRHWKESRIGLLLRMSGDRYDADPQPVLPPELRYEAMVDTLSELGKTGSKQESSQETPEESPEESPEDFDAEETAWWDVADPGIGLFKPTLLSRQVVASGQNWEAFGPLLASQAWYQGFAAATRKVFVSDGSSTLAKLQQRNFSHYTSVLDLLHALAYSLAAARAVSDDEQGAERQYDVWAAKIWEGRVEDVIEELRDWRAKMGEPPPEPRGDDPREVLRVSCRYYQNHISRMNYPAYRRSGFPLTSSLMESTVKLVGRRVKGSEKFWSPAGGEALLRLRGEYLSDNRPMHRYWQRRASTCNGTRAYRSHAKVNK